MNTPGGDLGCDVLAAELAEARRTIESLEHVIARKQRAQELGWEIEDRMRCEIDGLRAENDTQRDELAASNLANETLRRNCDAFMAGARLACRTLENDLIEARRTANYWWRQCRASRELGETEAPMPYPDNDAS